MEHLHHYNSAQPDQPVLFRQLSDIVNNAKVEKLYFWITGQQSHKSREEIFVYIEEDEAESSMSVRCCYPYKDDTMHTLQGDELDVVGMGLYGDLTLHHKINGYYTMAFQWNEATGRVGVMIRPLRDKVPFN